MATFGDRLRHLRRVSKMTQRELAHANGLGESTVSMYEQGKREPDFEILEKLAEYFNVDLNYLLGRIDTAEFKPVERNLPKIRNVPLYGHIPAGVPFEAIQNDLGEVEVPSWLSDKEDLFGLIVVGDSMNRVIPDGYVAVLQKTDSLNNGDIGAFLIDGQDATLKKFYKLTDYVVLEPLSFNPDHRPLMIGRDGPEINVIGKMLWSCAARGY